ncbi:thioredoxin family protein [uncultured Clostridium sp.]|uniref:thioredoxin family protein n=1 Tax=uncultured Clostridium sp. TaxID=59620 RepID=UPI0025DB168E|nr:thioredoxin family protein [uncultured Clostridium sp.]
MMRLDIGLDYDEYLSMAKEEEKEFIYKLFDQGVLKDEGLDRIKDIKEELNVIIFAEPGCKDAATTIPFLIKMTQINPKIKLKYLRREGNEDLLEKLTGEKKVPTFIIVDNMGKVVRKYIEFPKKLKEKLLNSPVEETQFIVDEMREGKYNDYIQEDLINFLSGQSYNFISFTRKDK